MIKGIKFVNIPVTNQDKALAFYTEKLGFKIVTDQPFDDTQRWIELMIPGGSTRVVLFTPETQKSWIGSFFNCTFFTDDLKKTYELYRQRGVEFVAPPKKEEWGSFALFKDLDGNQFCLSQS
jgi:catechol 2,3-dioxygenase-like lactoylglutathione lyase family enzyme